MSGNVFPRHGVFSRNHPWRVIALVGSGLLWLTGGLAEPAAESVVASDPSLRPSLISNLDAPPPDATLPLDKDSAMLRPAQRHHDLLERVRTQGRLPVIVRLQLSAAPPDATVDDSETQQQAMIAAIQQQVIERLLRATGTSRDRLAIKTFSLTPALGLQVDERELRALLTYPEVSSVIEDAALPPLDR